MPTAYIKKLSKEGKGSIESLEKKWNDAKAKAREEGKGDNYALITTIFQSMIGASTIEAKARLLATADVEAAHNFVPPRYKDPFKTKGIGAKAVAICKDFVDKNPELIERLRNV